MDPELTAEDFDNYDEQLDEADQSLSEHVSEDEQAIEFDDDAQIGRKRKLQILQEKKLIKRAKIHKSDFLIQTIK